jgi:hypothetical protein
MITATTPATDGTQLFQHNGETLVTLTAKVTFWGTVVYRVSSAGAVNGVGDAITSDAGKAFGVAMDRAFEMIED